MHIIYIEPASTFQLEPLFMRSLLKEPSRLNNSMLSTNYNAFIIGKLSITKMERNSKKLP